MAAPDELIEDALAEILLRVPPDEPADLVRASLVDKRWRRILTDSAFLRRYREFHRAPPLLGFFQDYRGTYVGTTARFVATTGARSPLPQPEFDGEEWRVVSCHHGRVLININLDQFIVWDPITGDWQRVGLPDRDSLRGTAFFPTVLCAVGSSCNHLNCHGGPFLMVGVGFVDGAIKVFVFSSEAGAWTQPASVDSQGVDYFLTRRDALIRDEIYYTLRWGAKILKYEVGTGRLSMFNPPEVYQLGLGACFGQIEDGSLGLTAFKGSSIYLWSRKETCAGAAAVWVQWRVIDFEKHLPSTELFGAATILDFADGVLFVGTSVGVFTIELKSGKVKRVLEPPVYYPILPFMSFYTPDCASSKLALQAGTSLPLLNRSMHGISQSPINLNLP